MRKNRTFITTQNVTNEAPKTKVARNENINKTNYNEKCII